MNETHDPTWKLATVCVHGGRRASSEDPALALPVVRSSTFLQTAESRAAIDDGRWNDALVYTRYGNPTCAAVEATLARLEGAQSSLLFASGMAALHAAMVSCTRPGSTVLVAEQLYGGTLDLLDNGLSQFDVRREFFDVADPASIDAVRADDINLVVCESVSNPILLVADIPHIARRAHARGAKLLVDATFATPIAQRPLELGADIVMHSATKYLSGHSDVTAGVLAGDASELRPIRDWRKRAGGVLDPESAFLLERGIKTLALRMRAHAEGARTLARALAEHPRVARVHYPGLETHPSFELAGRLLRSAGGMLSFEVVGGDPAARACSDRLRLAFDAPSLGGVETLVSLPASMSHAHLSPAERESAGIRPGLVRVSVGIEDPADLVQDFRDALDALPG